MLRDRNKKKIRKRILGAYIASQYGRFRDFLQNIAKTPILCDYLHPLGCVSKYCFCFHLVAISIGYVVVYSIFSVGASLEEKFAKQNGGDTRRKKISEKALIAGRQF